MHGTENSYRPLAGAPDTERGATLLHTLLDETAGTTPLAPAVRDAAGAWSYAELTVYSHAVERWLRRRGVRRGDRLVVQLPSTREQVALLFGASRCGAVFVPLNPAMKPFHLTSVIENAEPVLLIGSDGAPTERLSGTSAPAVPFGTAWREIEAELGAGAEAPVDPARAEEVGPEDIALLIYTSGSTAAPKAVIGPHAPVTYAVHAMQEALGYRPDDVVFCRFPLSWDYGLYKVLLTCVAGAEIVLAGEESDLRLVARLRETAATIVPIVPSLATMIASLAAREEGPVAPVRMFTNTGAALPPATTAALRAAFPGARVVRQFGQTECKRVSVMPPHEDTERPDSVGLPLPGTRVRILDGDGTRLPAGQTGEIVVSGPHVMPGYWRAPEVTARSFRRDAATGELRLHTGDFGHLDEDGYLYFEGRRDDMFKRRGIRMSTLEIEGAAMDIPGVRAAAAVPPGAHDLTLWVETDLAPTAVLRQLAERLEPAKVPAHCRVIDALPLTQHGKNARAQLAAMLEEGE